MEHVDAIVVGAGQAGLATSYFLSQAGIRHTVLERGVVGDSWVNQRWDSFAVNTPNWSNALPEAAYEGPEPKGFYLRDELVASFQDYARSNNLPVRENTNVTNVELRGEGQPSRFMVESTGGDFATDAVFVCSGIMSRPRIPGIGSRLPAEILQLTTANYRNPGQLPDGAVLVVGAGQSGCQIAEELILAGRTTYLSTSRVGRVVRSHRGRDFVEWWRDMGFLDVRVEDLEDPAMKSAIQPQISGTDGGHTLSLQQLSRDGCILLGRLSDVDGVELVLAPDLMDNMRFADEMSERFKKAMDDYIERSGMQAPPREDDPAESPVNDVLTAATIRLDLEEARISTVIWCTGFDADFGWIRVPVFDQHGAPRHERGVSSCDGLYFVGFPWLSKRKSGIIYGIGEDARCVVDHLVTAK